MLINITLLCTIADLEGLGEVVSGCDEAELALVGLNAHSLSRIVHNPLLLTISKLLPSSRLICGTPTFLYKAVSSSLTILSCINLLNSISE